MPLFEIPQSHLAKTVSLTPFVLNGHKKTGRLKKLAFTLAETLITLVIVGVVAALAIPTLISKYQKHTYVAGVKKAYSVVSQAVKMIPITEGCSGGDYSCLPSDWVGEREQFLSIFKKQLKVAKSCTSENAEECADIEALRKEAWCPGLEFCGIPFQSFGTVISEDSMAFSFSSLGVFVDINAKKGPNKYGRDIFIFRLETDASNKPTGKVVPVGSKEYANIVGSNSAYWNDNPAAPECDGKNPDTMGLCAGRVLEENAMNY